MAMHGKQGVKHMARHGKRYAAHGNAWQTGHAVHGMLSFPCLPQGSPCRKQNLNFKAIGSDIQEVLS